jgi:hypothetical protein
VKGIARELRAMPEASIQILDVLEAEALAECLAGAPRKPVLDGQFQSLQFLDAKYVGPAPRPLGAQFGIELLVILHQAK